MGRRALLTVSLQAWALFEFLWGLITTAVWVPQRAELASDSWGADAWSEAMVDRMLVQSVASVAFGAVVLLASRPVARLLLRNHESEGARRARPLLVAGLVAAGISSAMWALRRLLAFVICPWPDQVAEVGEELNAPVTRTAVAAAVLALAAACLPRLLERRRRDAEQAATESAPAALATVVFHTLGLGLFAAAGLSFAMTAASLFSLGGEGGVATLADFTPWMLVGAVGVPAVLAMAGLLLVRQGGWLAGRLNPVPPDAPPAPVLDRHALRWFGLGLLGSLALLRAGELLYTVVAEEERSEISLLESQSVWSLVGFLLLALATLAGPGRVLRLVRGLRVRPRTFVAVPLSARATGQLLRIGLGVWLSAEAARTLVTWFATGPGLFVLPGTAIVAGVAGALLLRVGLPRGALRRDGARTAFELAGVALVLSLVPEIASVFVELREGTGAQFGSEALWASWAVPWSTFTALACAAGCVWWAYRKPSAPGTSRTLRG